MTQRTIALRLIGAVLLSIGLVAALYGPLEFLSFYFYSFGGRWHYAGFGFGSPWFALVTAQITGFYLVAGVCLPLGYGHILLRPWTGKLSLAVLWTWLILGLPCTAAVLLIFVSSKAPGGIHPAVAALLFLVWYPGLPLALLYFYRNTPFPSDTPSVSWWSHAPLPILILGALLAFCLLALHMPLFLHGVVPVFGTFVKGLPGFALVAQALVLLGFIISGTLWQYSWAFFAANAFLVLLAASTAVSLWRHDLAAFLGHMTLTDWETDLRSVSVDGSHLALVCLPPMLATLGVLLRSKKYFHKKTTGPQRFCGLVVLIVFTAFSLRIWIY